MNIEKSVNGTTTELKLSGWLDTQSSPMLEQAVGELDSGTEELILECIELEYISSAGLRQLVAAYKKMNGEMTLRHLSPEVMNVIRMTGLDRRIRFE